MKINILLLLASLSVTTAYGSGYESDEAPSRIELARQKNNEAIYVIQNDPEKKSLAEKIQALNQLIPTTRQEYALEIAIQKELVDKTKQVITELARVPAPAACARRIDFK